MKSRAHRAPLIALPWIAAAILVACSGQAPLTSRMAIPSPSQSSAASDCGPCFTPPPGLATLAHATPYPSQEPRNTSTPPPVPTFYYVCPKGPSLTLPCPS